MANSVSRAGKEPAALPPSSEVRELLRGPSIPSGVLNERSKGLPRRSASAERVASRCPDCGHGSSRHTPQGGCMQGKTDRRGRQVACPCNRTFRTSANWDYLGVPGPPATEYQAPKVKAPKGLKVIKQPKAPAAPKAPPASMPAAPKAPKAPAAPKAAKPGRKQAGPGQPRVSLSRRLRADALSDERSQVVPAQTTAQDWPGGQAMDTGYQPSSTSESAGAALPAEAGGSAAQSPQQSSQGPSGRQEDQMGVDAGAGQGGFGGSGGMGMGDVMGLVSPMVNAGAGLASGVASGVGGAISGMGAPGLGGAISGLGGALSGAASGVMSGVSGLGGMFTGAAVEHYYRTGSWHSRTAGGSYDGSWPDDEPWGSLPGGQQVRGEAPKVKRKRKSPRVEWRDGEPYIR